MLFSFLQALESSIGQQEQENKKSVEVRLARYDFFTNLSYRMYQSVRVQYCRPVINSVLRVQPQWPYGKLPCPMVSKKGEGKLFFLFLNVWWHAAALFIYFYINRAYTQYFIYNSRRVPLFISSLLPLGRGPPLGCRVEILTGACHAASRRATV
jgi:hypothetical protein